MNETLTAIFNLQDGPFSRGADRIIASLASIESRTGRVSQNIDNQFNKAFNTVTKFAGGFFAVDKALDLLKQGLKITSDIERLDAGLSNVSSSSLDFARSQAFLRKLSDDLGISIEELEVSYKNLKAATNNTILQGAQTERIFTAVVHAGAAMKLSNEDIRGSLLALTQMLSKGTVSMEELRGQLAERIPAAFKLAADAMGVSEEKLVQMISSGQVMATDLLPKLATQLENTYGAKAQANAESMAGGWQRGTDQLKLFIAEFAHTNGIDTFFAKLFNGMGNYLKQLRQAQEQTGSIFGTSKSYTPGFQKDLNTFNGLDAAQKESFLAKFAKNIAGKEAQLNGVVRQAPSDENLALEKQLDGEIKVMKERFAIYRRALRAENDKIAQEQAQANKFKVAPTFDIDKAKDRQGALEKQIQNYVGNGKAVPSAIRDEYTKLTAQIDRATEATKKQRDFTGKTSFSVLEVMERAKKGIEDLIAESRSLKGFVPPELNQQLTIAEQNIRRLKGEVEKSPFMKLISNGLANQNILGEEARRERFGRAVTDRSGEVKAYGSTGFFQEQLSKIQSIIQQGTGLGKKIIDPDALDLARNYTAELTKIDIATRQLNRVQAAAAGKAEAGAMKGFSLGDAFNTQNWTDTALAKLAEARAQVIGSAQEMTAALQTTLQAGAQGAAQAMGDLVGGLIAGTANMDDLPGAVLGVVADMLRNLAAALAASAAAMLFVPGLQGQAIGQLAGATGLYAAAALAQAAAQPKRRAMAKGGTLSGPTDITAGEYPGAGRKGRQEWVSPVDVGANLIAENLMKMGGFGGGDFSVRHEVEGTKLVLLIDRVYKQQRITGRR